VDIEKGRENCREYVQERKLVRVAKEAGMTTDEVVGGLATGELGAESSASDGVEVVGVEASTKGRAD
jgi:hypothetical protein